MNIRRSPRLARGAVVALALPLFLTGLAAPASAATPAAGGYSDAYGLMVDATLLEGNVPLSVGPEAAVAASCEPTGPEKSTNLLEAGDPAAAYAEVLGTKADANCTTKVSKSSARVVNVDALDGTPITIHADLVTAASETSCTAAPKGSTDIIGLSIAGQDVPLPDEIEPNMLVADPVLSALGITVILNEQHPASLGRGLVVNAIHVIANNSGAIPVGGSVLRGDVVISHAVSSVVCPGGPGTDNGGLPKPDISFFKQASPDVADKGDTVTYTALVTNQSAKPCEVLKFIDHVAPPFSVEATAGVFGTTMEKVSRSDGGTDAVIRPTGVTIGAGKSVTQTFTVKVKDDANPGTYYDTLEIYCGPNGNFISGPLAPVTIPGDGPVLPPVNPVENPPTITPPDLAATGGAPALAAVSLLVLAAAVGMRRMQLHRSS